MTSYKKSNLDILEKFRGTQHCGEKNAQPIVSFRMSPLNRMKVAFICCLGDDHSDYFDILIADQGKVIASSFVTPFIFRTDAQPLFFHHNVVQGFEVFHMVHDREVEEGRKYSAKDYKRISENTSSVVDRVIKLGSIGMGKEADEHILDLMNNETGREEDERMGYPFYILDRDRSSSLYLTAPRPVHHDWDGLNAFLEEYH